jgi:hypothetical protein
MARLLQIRSHIVFCLRAEEKIRYVKAYNEERKREETKIVNAGWVPICEKNFMYELTASFLLSPDHPGVPQPIKLQAQHAPMIDTTQPLTERAGELLARWAGGADPAPRPPQGPPPARVNPAPTSPAQPALLDESGAPTPSYKPDDALMMLAKIKGRDVTATDLEIAFARGVRSVPKLALYAKQHWDAYRQAFDELHRRYIAWKDEHA